MSNPLGGIDYNQLEIFKEIGNIGAGNAATALASILNMQINMSVPTAKIVPFNEIVNILNGPETLVAGVLVDMSGQMNGHILLVLELSNAMEMISVALNTPVVDTTDLSTFQLSELESSTLTEISNILVGSFLSAISSFTNLKVTPSVPQLAIDMLGAIMSIVAIEYGKIGDSVLFLETQFSDVLKEITGQFFLIPDYESYKILMGSLGLGE